MYCREYQSFYHSLHVYPHNTVGQHFNVTTSTVLLIDVNYSYMEAVVEMAIISRLRESV